jgi:hypothetical protein
MLYRPLYETCFGYYRESRFIFYFARVQLSTTVCDTAAQDPYRRVTAVLCIHNRQPSKRAILLCNASKADIKSQPPSRMEGVNCWILAGDKSQ